MNWIYKIEQKFPATDLKFEFSFVLSPDGLNVTQSKMGPLHDNAFTSTTQSLLKLGAQYDYFFTLDAAAITRITCSEEITPFLTLLLRKDPESIPVDERYLSDEEMLLYDFASDVYGGERGCLLEVNGNPWTNWGGGSYVPAMEISELCVNPWAKVSVENWGEGNNPEATSTIGEFNPEIGIVVDDNQDGFCKVKTFLLENPAQHVYSWALQGEFIKVRESYESRLESRTFVNALAALIAEERPTGVFPGLVAFRHATESELGEVIDVEVYEDYFGLDFPNMWTVSLGLDEAQQAFLIRLIKGALPNAPEYVLVKEEVELP